MKAYETCLSHKNRKRLVQYPSFFKKKKKASIFQHFFKYVWYWLHNLETKWLRKDLIPSLKNNFGSYGIFKKRSTTFKKLSMCVQIHICVEVSSYSNEKWDLRICALGNPLPCPSCSRTLKGKSNTCPTCHTTASLFPNMVDFRILQDGWKIWSHNMNA